MAGSHQRAVEARIAETARSMRDGQLSFIEGARRICSLAHKISMDRDDPDLIAFTVIDSETDTLPMGEVRKLWQPDALLKLQPEIDHAQTWARETGLGVCESLIARFGNRGLEEDH